MLGVRLLICVLKDPGGTDWAGLGVELDFGLQDLMQPRPKFIDVGSCIGHPPIRQTDQQSIGHVDWTSVLAIAGALCGPPDGGLPVGAALSSVGSVWLCVVLSN